VSINFVFFDYLFFGYIINLQLDLKFQKAGIKMDEYNFEDIIKNDIQIEIHKQLLKCFKRYGIEGTEDKLKNVLNKLPVMRELFLTEYYKIIQGK